MKHQKILFIFIFLAGLSDLSAQSKSFHFLSADRVRVYGDYFTKGKKGPGLLLVHMCNIGDRSHYKSLATKLKKKGFNVLTFDFRGHGESTTNQLDVAKNLNKFWERENNGIMEDIRLAYEYLLERPEVDSNSIAVVGASCSVKRALQLASNQKNIKALILMSGQANELGINYLANNPEIAVFGAAAEDDGQGLSSAWITKILNASTNKINQKKIYPTGGHGTELLKSYPNLEKEMISWLSQIFMPK